MRASYTIEAAVINHVGARDMTSVQDSWENMLDATKKLCSDEFWKIFLQLHMCSTRVIDSALRSVKKAFVKKKRESETIPDKQTNVIFENGRRRFLGGRSAHLRC